MKLKLVGATSCRRRSRHAGDEKRDSQKQRDLGLDGFMGVESLDEGRSDDEAHDTGEGGAEDVAGQESEAVATIA